MPTNCFQPTDLIAHLQLSINVEGKSGLELVKLIRTAVDNVVVDSGHIDLEIYLRDALAFNMSSVPPLEKTAEETNLTKLEIKLLAMKLEKQNRFTTYLKGLEEDNPNPNQCDKLTYVSLIHQIESG